MVDSMWYQVISGDESLLYYMKERWGAGEFLTSFFSEKNT